MTYNEKRRYLDRYSYSIRRVKNLNRELEEWQTIATNITQKITPVTVKNKDNESKIERCAIRIAEIENDILDEISAAEEYREQISTAVGSIKDTRRRELIEMRYITGLSVNNIAGIIGKDEDNIYKMIRKTIKSMEI